VLIATATVPAGLCKDADASVRLHHTLHVVLFPRHCTADTLPVAVTNSQTSATASNTPTVQSTWAASGEVRRHWSCSCCHFKKSSR